MTAAIPVLVSPLNDLEERVRRNDLIEISSIQKSEAVHFIIWNAKGSKFVLQWSCGPDVANSDAVRLDVDPSRVVQVPELAHGIVKDSSMILEAVTRGQSMKDENPLVFLNEVREQLINRLLRPNLRVQSCGSQTVHPKGFCPDHTSFRFRDELSGSLLG